ncbi:MAG: ABC transporter ATP-binding protein, partial [Thermoprotei archaeon]
LFDRELDDKEKEELVKESLKAVGLNPDEILGKYPHELSGGQRQRLMIARCYMLKPKLIIADEPTSMIDASSRAGIIQLLNSLRDNYKTSVLFITHDLGLAYYVSDRIMIMYRGRIIEEGEPDEILSHPQHEYTKMLVRSAPLLYRKWEDFV